MKLYEIDQEIENCIDLETGEVLDPERLTNLKMERERKLEGVALWIKNLKVEAEGLKLEKQSFEARQKATEDKIRNLSDWLTNALEGNAFETTKTKVSFRRSESVEVTDIKLLPECFVQVKVERAPDKKLIKEAIKGGMEVEGCKIVKKANIQIK